MDPENVTVPANVELPDTCSVANVVAPVTDSVVSVEAPACTVVRVDPPVIDSAAAISGFVSPVRNSFSIAVSSASCALSRPASMTCPLATALGA